MVNFSGSIGKRIEREHNLQLERQRREAVRQNQQLNEQQSALRHKYENEQNRTRPHAQLAEMISEDSMSIRAKADNTSGYAIINKVYPSMQSQGGMQAELVVDTFYKDFPSLIFHLSLRVADRAGGATTEHYIATSMLPPESVQEGEMDYGFRFLSRQQRKELEKSTTSAWRLADCKLPRDEADQVAGIINEAYDLRQVRMSAPGTSSGPRIPEAILRIGMDNL